VVDHGVLVPGGVDDAPVLFYERLLPVLADQFDPEGYGKEFYRDQGHIGNQTKVEKFFPEPFHMQ